MRAIILAASVMGILLGYALTQLGASMRDLMRVEQCRAAHNVYECEIVAIPKGGDDALEK